MMLLPYQKVIKENRNAKSTATNQVERRYSIIAFIILFEKNDRMVSWKVKYNTLCLLGLSNLHNLKKTIGILFSEIDTNLAFCMYHRHASHNVHIYWFILMFFFPASPPPSGLRMSYLYTCGFGAFLFLTLHSIAILFINHCIIKMIVHNHLIQKNKSWRQNYSLARLT